MSLRVLVVDDHRLLRDGLRRMIDGESDIEVVGEAESGRVALRLSAELRPDVVLMDIGMKDLNGVEATRQICGADPDIRVIGLSTHSDKRYVLGMLDAGATGYVLKDSAYDEVRDAIRAVGTGKTYLSPDIAGLVVESSLGLDDGKERRIAAELTPREREIVQLVAEGLTTVQIGARLNVSPSTVDTHRKNAMTKLNFSSVAELTKYALRAGLTSLDD